MSRHDSDCAAPRKTAEKEVNREKGKNVATLPSAFCRGDDNAFFRCMSESSSHCRAASPPEPHHATDTNDPPPESPIAFPSTASRHTFPHTSSQSCLSCPSTSVSSSRSPFSKAALSVDRFSPVCSVLEHPPPPIHSDAGSMFKPLVPGDLVFLPSYSSFGSASPKTAHTPGGFLHPRPVLHFPPSPSDRTDFVYSSTTAPTAGYRESMSPFVRKTSGEKHASPAHPLSPSAIGRLISIRAGPLNLPEAEKEKPRGKGGV